MRRGVQEADGRGGQASAKSLMVDWRLASRPAWLCPHLACSLLRVRACPACGDSSCPSA